MKYIFSFVICLILTLIFLKYLPAPYFWSGVLWVCFFSILFLKEQKGTLKAIFLNLAIIVLFLTSAEIYFWKPFAPKTKNIGNFWSPEAFKKDPLLGYAPPKNAPKISAKILKGKDIIYDMTFSTNDQGLRNSYQASDAKEAIVFFGCSFTFGIGVNDDKTLPYQTGMKVKNPTNTYNFSFGGYGPHHMLCALEHGLVGKVVSEKPTFAIYTALPTHISRSAGLMPWSIHDPKYEIDGKGEIYFAGHFDDNSGTQNIWGERIFNYLNKSFIIAKILSSRTRSQNDEDLEKYIKIVVRSRDLFENQYKGAKFHVILWPLLDPQNTQIVYDKMLKGLRDNNIQVHLVNEILPNFHPDDPLYQIAQDGHPTPEANARIANYIVENIVTK